MGRGVDSRFAGASRSRVASRPARVVGRRERDRDRRSARDACVARGDVGCRGARATDFRRARVDGRAEDSRRCVRCATTASRADASRASRDDRYGDGDVGGGACARDRNRVVGGARAHGEGRRVRRRAGGQRVRLQRNGARRGARASTRSASRVRALASRHRDERCRGVRACVACDHCGAHGEASRRSCVKSVSAVALASGATSKSNVISFGPPIATCARSTLP